MYAGPYNFNSKELPIVNDNGSSPYHDSSRSGFQNAAYAPDSEHVDSVSQVIAMRRQTSNAPYTSDMSEREMIANIHGNNTSVLGSPALSNYHGRSIPSTVIRRSKPSPPITNHTNRIVNDGEWGIQAWPGNASNVSQSHTSAGSQNEGIQYSILNHINQHGGSDVSQPISSRDSNASVAMATIHSSSSPQPGPDNGNFQEEVFHAATGQNSNPYLTPAHQMAPTTDHGYIPYDQTTIQQQTVLPRSQIQIGQGPQSVILMPISTVPTSNRSTVVVPEGFEMKEMVARTVPPHPHQSSYYPTQIINETPMMTNNTNTNSPIQYASPGHGPLLNNKGEPVTIIHMAQQPILYENQIPATSHSAHMSQNASSYHPVGHLRQFSENRDQQPPEHKATYGQEPRNLKDNNLPPHHHPQHQQAAVIAYGNPEDSKTAPDLTTNSGKSSEDRAPTTADSSPISAHPHQHSLESVETDVEATDVKFTMVPESALPPTAIFSTISNV